MNKLWLRIALFLLVPVAVTRAFADPDKVSNMNCDGLPVTSHEFQPQATDVLKPQHLEIARPFTGNGKLEVSVCDAGLHIRPNTQAKELKLLVEMQSQPDGHAAADYVHIFDVDPDHGRIHLKFEKSAHATVTLIVPMSAGSTNEINLGRGDLVFDAIGTAGQREFNVGLGDMKLLVDSDKSYSGMEVNIGMGSLHDHRPGGRDGHLVVSRNYSGSGDGSLKINVGMGSLNISQE